MDPNRPIPRHIIKMTRLKDKEKILKDAREKQVITYKGAPIRLSSDFSTETFQGTHGDKKQRPTIKATLPSKATI